MNEAISDGSVRIEGMWPFPAGQMAESLIEEFEMADKMPSPLEKLKADLWGELREMLFSHLHYEREEAWMEMSMLARDRKISGFVVQASVPVFDVSEAGGVSFTWGHTYQRMFFAESANAALQLAADWHDELYAAARTLGETRREATSQSA